MKPSALPARLQLEELESRQVLAGVQPTAVEQLFLEQLNDARANPAAYGASIGLNLAGVAPSQPLAFDPLLIQAARGHSADMATRGYFSHYTPEGADPGARIRAVGFNWSSYGESIAGGSVYTGPAEALRALIIDAGIADLGHRRHLLAIDAVFKPQGQVGIGVVQNTAGPLTNYYTIDSASSAGDSRPFITGVVFNDINRNGRYDIGEGLGGAQVLVHGVGIVTTFDSGGYSVRVSPGAYTVTVSGGPVGSPVTQTVSVGTSNLRLNFNPVSAPPNLLAVATTFTHSAESFSLFVQQAYQQYVGRPAEPSGLSYWVGRLQQGLTDEQLEASFLGSAEYIANHGGTGRGWVVGMYQDLLGRTPVSSEVDYWVGRLATGMPPTMVAYGFAASAEREGMRVRDNYDRYLGRSATQGEVNYWVGQFLVGARNEGVVAGFVGSAEYYFDPVKGNGTVSGWITSAYQDVFQRTPSQSEIDFWASRLG